MPQFILALDQGTTSSRSILFDAAGTPVATAQREFTQHFPRSGWVEHDAEEIWATQAATITEVLARARATPARRGRDRHHQPARDDRAVGSPHRPAGRAAPSSGRTGARPRCAQQLQGRRPRTRGRRGAPACCSIRISRAPSSRGCSINVPGARRRAEAGELAFGTIDSWLVWKLSDGAARTSPT